MGVPTVPVPELNKATTWHLNSPPANPVACDLRAKSKCCYIIRAYQDCVKFHL